MKRMKFRLTHQHRKRMLILVLMAFCGITTKAQSGKLAYDKQLAQSNKLVGAGLFEKNDKNFAGIFILNAANLEEAAALLETDPAVKAGLLDSEMFQWYGSAARPLYLKYHDSVKAKDF